MQLWKLTSPPSAVWAAALETQESCGAHAVQRQPAGEAPLSGRGKSCSIQDCSWLNEAHPHCGGQSAGPKVH